MTAALFLSDRKELQNMNQKQTPLLDALVEYTGKRPAYFKIPGHRYERGISPRWRQWTGDGIFRFDLTEAEGLDDLHCPRGVIRQAQELTAEVFHARKSYFLVNGTTCGNEAMILAAVNEGEKIMIPRNAHKSVLMGLILSGACPVDLVPEFHKPTGCCGVITPESVEEGFRRNPDCKAVFLVSPTYYGICSDIAGIAEVCHRHHALLLVDEAHGGHLYFTDRLPRGAILQGADLCAQSMHKVTGSLTQSSLLHVGSDRPDPGRLEECLQMVQSTSPSYLLMTSLDAARYELANHGKEMAERAVELAESVRRRISRIPGIRCPGKEIIGKEIYDLDSTRLVISASELGISGYRLSELLYESYGVGMELADDRNVVGVVTYANLEEETDRLVNALEQISRENGGRRGKAGLPEETVSFGKICLPERVCTPRQAWYAPGKTIPWRDAEGKIAGEPLIPYPPGIPLVNPGERITAEIWQYMEMYRKAGLPFHGPRDKSLRMYQIIPEENL